MLNALYDPQVVQSYHSEYLSLIKYYMNIKRPSSFVRYYNIDVNNSTYDEKLEATYDLYTYSNIKFNLYDFTPTYYIAPVVNATSNVTDMRGQMLDATSSIVVYTITPKIHDLVMFYGPIKSGEIFRITNFRTSINALHTDVNLTWFELDLEYAPISDAKQLKILNHYVYDLSKESYIGYNDYTKLIDDIKQTKIILDQLQKYYDPYYDVYQANNMVPIEVNEAIIFFKRQYGLKYNRLFDEFLFPYGYLDIFNDQMFYSNYTELPYSHGNYTYHVYDIVNRKVVDFTWSISYQTAEDPISELFLLSYQLLKLAFSWSDKDILDK